jgi:hypothetical protein
MDRLSSVMLRAALIWLLIGVIAGGIMLSGGIVPGSWRVWSAPSHVHMLFVGWFLQFSIGVAYWLLPRRRSPERQLGYRERPAFVAVVALNLGLILRVLAEPAARAGLVNDVTSGLLVVSALLQVGAVVVFVAQLWSRSAARPLRKVESA